MNKAPFGAFLLSIADHLSLGPRLQFSLCSGNVNEYVQHALLGVDDLAALVMKDVGQLGVDRPCNRSLALVH